MFRRCSSTWRYRKSLWLRGHLFAMRHPRLEHFCLSKFGNAKVVLLPDAAQPRLMVIPDKVRLGTYGLAMPGRFAPP